MHKDQLLDHSLRAISGGVCVLALEGIPKGESAYTDWVDVKKCGVEGVGGSLGNGERVVVRPLEAVKRCEEGLDDYSVYTVGSSPETSSQSPKPQSQAKAVLKGFILPFSLGQEAVRCCVDGRKKRKSISDVFQQLKAGKSVPNPFILPKNPPNPLISHTFKPSPELEMDYSSFLRHSQRYSLYKERTNIATICRFARKHPSVPVLIAPISSPSVLPETCPANVSFGTAVPYLAFSFPDLVKPEDPVWKSIPPIRDTETRGNLQTCVLSAASLLTIASFPQSQRLSDKYLCAFNQAEDGLMTLGYGLQGIWTSLRGRNAVEEENLLLLLADYLATKPAQWLGLQRGRIEAGYAGDILIWDPWTAVEAENDPLSPYAGMKLLGKVCEVYLRGSLVYSQGGAALITGRLSS